MLVLLEFLISHCNAKSAYEPSGPLGRSLSRFLLHEATRSISKIQVGPTGLEPMTLYDSGAMLYQLSCEANRLIAGQFVALIKFVAVRSWLRILLEPPKLFRCL